MWRTFLQKPRTSSRDPLLRGPEKIGFRPWNLSRDVWGSFAQLLVAQRVQIPCYILLWNQGLKTMCIYVYVYIYICTYKCISLFVGFGDLIKCNSFVSGPSGLCPYIRGRGSYSCRQLWHLGLFSEARATPRLLGTSTPRWIHVWLWHPSAFHLCVIFGGLYLLDT